MTIQDNARDTTGLLAAADRKFAEGKRLEGSELMWKATKQAIVSVALQRNWPCASDEDVGASARLLAQEHGDGHEFLAKFGIAETFQYNTSADVLEDDDIEICRELLTGLIHHLLQQVAPPGNPE